MRTAVMVLSVIGFSLSALLPERLPAQAGRPSVVTTPALSSDSTAGAGLRNGQVEARKIPVVWRGLAGFVSGLPVGFLGPFLIFGGSPVGALGIGAGGAGMYVAAQKGSRAPSDSLTGVAQERGAGYASSFSAGYSDQLLARRRAAAILGGVAGTATGVGVLFLMIVAAFD